MLTPLARVPIVLVTRGRPSRTLHDHYRSIDKLRKDSNLVSYTIALTSPHSPGIVSLHGVDVISGRYQAYRIVSYHTGKL